MKLKSIIFLIPIFLFLLFAVPTFAAIPPMKLNVPIGSLTEINTSGNILGEYFSIWYNFLTGAVGIIATAMIMYGGFKWITSRGGGQVGQAKEIISSALLGLVLALLSWVILNTLNPALVNIGLPEMTSISGGGEMQKPNISYRGMSMSGEGAANGSPNTTSPGATGGSNAKIPCPSANGTPDYSRAYTASYEGYSATPYWDVDGYTVGYGHHYPGSTAVPPSVTEEQAYQIYQQDYNTAYNAAQSTFPNWSTMSPGRQAAMIDMAYNMGPGVFSVFPSMTASVISGDYEAAANHMLDSDYARQLAQRSANNADLLRGNDQLYIDQASAACK